VTDRSTNGHGAARPVRILVAEDDDAMRGLLVRWLREAGYCVMPCADGLDLRARLEMSVLSGELGEFDLLVSDVRMPLGSALEVLEEFLHCDGIPPTLLITAFGSRRIRTQAERLGAGAVLEKPFERGHLLAEVERLRARDPAPLEPPAGGLPQRGGTRS
jgi:DNA-binding response OmpR family regulator